MPPNLAALELRHCDCATAGPGPTGVTCRDSESSTCLLKRDTSFARGLSPSSDSDDPPRGPAQRLGQPGSTLHSPRRRTGCCQASLSSPGSRPGRASLICFAWSGSTGRARTTVRLRLSRAGRGQASLASPGPDRGQASSAGLGPHLSRLARAVDSLRLRWARTDRCQVSESLASPAQRPAFARPARAAAGLLSRRAPASALLLSPRSGRGRLHLPLTASLTSPAFMQLHTAFASGHTLPAACGQRAPPSS